MKYGRNIMQDMGVWQDFKNSLNNRIENKINVIEKFLDVSIIFKSIIPLRYKEANQWETSFLSKEFEIIFNNN